MAKKLKSTVIFGVLIFFLLSTAISAIDVAVIGIKPHTPEQWVAAEKISGTLYKALKDNGFNLLSSGQVDSMVGDRKTFLERYNGGIPSGLLNVDAVVVGYIRPEKKSFETVVTFYNAKGGQSVEIAVSGDPQKIDKNVANALVQRINTGLNAEHKVTAVSGQSVDLLSGGGLGLFRGQRFNVYRQEKPSHSAFQKYMSSSYVKVGEIEVTSVTGNRATARIIKEDPNLRIRVGDLVSTQGVQSFGSIYVDSIPRGATVYLDNFPLGRTPLTIINVPEGTYQLIIKEPMYQDVVERVKVKADSQVRIAPILPERPGQLQINSNLPGEVYINDVKKGTTPLTVEIPKGFYRVELAVAGYPLQQQSVWVTPGLSSTVFFHVSGSPAEVTFQSDPQGASVYIDGRYVGQTPLGSIYVEPGYHDIRMSKQGWRDWSETLLFNSGKREQINARLALPPGILTIYTDPERATVLVDGKDVGKTPLTYTEAGPGTVKVDIIKDGYRPVSKTFVIYSNERFVVDEKLERKVGTLSINSSPSNAEVYLNSEFKGKTPIVLENIPEGRHKLELKDRNLASRDIVIVSDREKTEFTAKLVPYWQLTNIEKRIIGSLGSDFGASQLVLGLETSFAPSPNLTLRAGFSNYSGDFGGGYGELANYNSFYAGGDFYFSKTVGLFGLGRYNAYKAGDTFTQGAAGLAFRFFNPESYIFVARVGGLYQERPRFYWETDFYTRLGDSAFVLGLNAGSSPTSNFEGRFSLGFSF